MPPGKNRRRGELTRGPLRHLFRAGPGCGPVFRCILRSRRYRGLVGSHTQCSPEILRGLMSFEPQFRMETHLGHIPDTCTFGNGSTKGKGTRQFSPEILPRFSEFRHRIRAMGIYSASRSIRSLFQPLGVSVCQKNRFRDAMAGK